MRTDADFGNVATGLFGQINYEMIEGFDLIIGLRYSKLERTITDRSFLYTGCGAISFLVGLQGLATSAATGVPATCVQNGAAFAANTSIAAAKGILATLPTDATIRAAAIAALPPSIGGLVAGLDAGTPESAVVAGARMVFEALPPGSTFTPHPNYTIALPGVGDVPSRFIVDGGPNAVERKESWSTVTWKFGLDYDIDDDHKIYGTISSGWRPGGWNFLNATPFAEEEMTAYEFGSKSSFLDKRLTFNTATFFYDYDNIQFSQLTESMQVISAIPGAEMLGIEIEGAYRDDNGFFISGNLAWMIKAEYTADFCLNDAGTESDPLVGVRDPNCSAPGSSVNARNVQGNQIARTPELGAFVSLGAVFDIGEMGTITPRLDVSWRDSVNLRAFADPQDQQESYTIVNINATWEFTNQKGSVEVFANNLTNTVYATNIATAPFNTVGIGRLLYYGAPRTYGIRFSGKF